jgi:hypothetical protein
LTEYTHNATALVECLRALPKDDHATWSKGARDGAVANSAAVRTQGPRQAVRVALHRGNRDAVHSRDKQGQNHGADAMMVQLITGAFAVYERHHKSGRMREAQRCRPRAATRRH